MKDLEYFRNKLTTLRTEIDGRLSTIDKDLRQKTSADSEEQAIELENAEVLDSLRTSTKRELMMVDVALQRLESGDYLSCSECGDEILTARLEALPFTAHCVKCAEELERK